TIKTDFLPLSSILTSDISYAIIPLDDIAKGDTKRIMDIQFTKYLPLTEATSYILLALAEPLHGYALMRKVGEMSQGTVKIGPGTLYGAFSQLEKEGLINMVKEANRRKSYVITTKGKTVLQEHIRRVEILVANSRLLV
ncbi:MAG TPA: PadR family transcriptional regulator, partial [Anaerolineales bacterium]|nr:PadR family transcriptional regulator [Anaerolineales bacterium]